jgi:hypothetical protein
MMHDIAKLVGLESRYAMGTRGQGEVAAELVEQMCTQAAAGSALVTRQAFYGVTRSLRLYNVLARIDGTAPRQLRRVVLMGAHYDTTNGAGPRADEEQGAPGVLTGRACTPSRCGPHQWLTPPPSPAPARAVEGADDNGSGVAAVLACLQLLAAAVASGAWRPEHTLIFAVFGAEEQGSIGSHRYLHNCAVERRNPLLDCKFTDAIPRHVARDKLPSCSGQLADAWRFDKSSFRGALILDQIGYRPPASAAQSRLPVLIEAEAAVGGAASLLTELLRAARTHVPEASVT